MIDNQLVGVREAAELKDMTITQLYYHIQAGRTPEPDRIEGTMKFWNREKIKEWQPKRYKKRGQA